MEKKENNLLSHNQSSSGNFSWILDELPYGISVQDTNHIVLYENKKVKELVGTYMGKQCFNRWSYIPGGGQGPCQDCMMTVTIKDKKEHKVFRRTINKQGEEIFLEIHHIPLIEENGEVNQFIELIKVCSEHEKGKVLSIQTPEEVLENIQFSIVQFGDLGGEIMTSDILSFVEGDELEGFLVKITVYIFGGLIQGVENQTGLFGPLPVLDRTEYEMLVYLFQIRNDLALDSRKMGIEQCMLLIFLKREYNFLFEKRELITDFLAEKVAKWGILQNITPEEHEILATELRSLLKQQIL